MDLPPVTYPHPSPPPLRGGGGRSRCVAFGSLPRAAGEGWGGGSRRGSLPPPSMPSRHEAIALLGEDREKLFSSSAWICAHGAADRPSCRDSSRREAARRVFVTDRTTVEPSSCLHPLFGGSAALVSGASSALRGSDARVPVETPRHSTGGRRTKKSPRRRRGRRGRGVSGGIRTGSSRPAGRCGRTRSTGSAARPGRRRWSGTARSPGC